MLPLSRSFHRFIASEQAGGILLLVCSLASLAIANTPWGPRWLELWHLQVAGLTLQHWVNDGLMVLFFLLVGLELERALYVGELSNLRAALLPILAAVGGICIPAAIHFALNRDTPAQAGAGIPMATDIAFALAAVAVLGSRVPTALKVFLAAVAVIDDLGAIVVIAAVYTSSLAPGFLLAAAGLYAALVLLNRLRVAALAPYLLGGVILWALMLHSGVHPTIAGVALAFAIPFTSPAGYEGSPSHRTENALQRPVALLVLPTFALANAGVVMSGGLSVLMEPNALGIILGLVVGKPLGITLACAAGVALGLRLPRDLEWSHIVGAGLLGGIGFTMSIFIANLAFPGDAPAVNDSKLAILVASSAAAVLGLSWLAWQRPPEGWRKV